MERKQIKTGHVVFNPETEACEFQNGISVHMPSLFLTITFDQEDAEILNEYSSKRLDSAPSTMKSEDEGLIDALKFKQVENLIFKSKVYSTGNFDLDGDR
jgi:hypothetical protein